MKLVLVSFTLFYSATCALMFARGSDTWLNAIHIKHAHIRHSCNDIHCVSHVLCEALVLTGIILTCGQRETTNIAELPEMAEMVEAVRNIYYSIPCMSW